MGSVVKNHPIRRIATTQHDKTSLMRGIYLAGMAAALAFQSYCRTLCLILKMGNIESISSRKILIFSCQASFA